METKIVCPICDGESVLRTNIKERTYRNDVFEINEYYYQCQKCDYSFTNDVVDNFNLKQVYNLYRERKNIPFPFQLIETREKYNLTYSDISELLGFGTNQFKLYEEGEMPSASNGTLLSLFIQPKELRNLICVKKNNIKKSEQILKKVDQVLEENRSSDFKFMLFGNDQFPDSLHGYLIPDFNKFTNLVLYFISNGAFKTRLNKLLFYSDFAHYKYYGTSISGVKYAAIPMGPVPDNYSLIYGLLERQSYITTELIHINGKENERFICKKEFNRNLFSDSEIEILDSVFNKFKNVSTKELIDISHEEYGWKDNEKNKSLINYSDYAPRLLAL